MHFKMIKQNFSKFILINLINFNSWFSLGFEKFCFPCEMSLPIETVFTILARLIPHSAVVLHQHCPGTLSTRKSMHTKVEKTCLNIAKLTRH